MTDFAARRTTMVDTQVRPSDVTSFPVIEAFLHVARESYVPDSKRQIAYMGADIPLEDGRVILDPRCFAKMLQLAAPQPNDVVLDLGCALGYSTAVLARLAQAVVGVEPDETRASDAQSALSADGVDNAAIMAGPLAEGAASSGPYDVILLGGAIETWPEALTAQLREGGRAVAIWAEKGAGVVRLGTRRGDAMAWKDDFNASAPVLPGFEKEQAFAL